MIVWDSTVAVSSVRLFWFYFLYFFLQFFSSSAFFFLKVSSVRLGYLGHSLRVLVVYHFIYKPFTESFMPTAEAKSSIAAAVDAKESFASFVWAF